MNKTTKHHIMRKHLNYRILASFTLLSVFLIIGTLGFHFIENLNWLDSFYVASMIISAEGAEGFIPSTSAGKIFTSLLAIFSVGMLVGIMILIFQPLARRWFKLILRAEEKVEEIEEKRKKK